MFFAGKFVLDLAEFAESKGLSRRHVILTSGKSEEQLVKEGCLVDYDCIANVFTAIKKEGVVQDFGLLMGEQINLQATAYLDRLMESCSGVEEAFQYAVAYSKLISDAMDCSLEISEDNFRVNFELNPNWVLKDDYAIHQNLNLALICTKNSLFRLTQREYFPLEVHFYYPKPRKLLEYYRLFNCRLKFNAKVSTIVFHRHILGRPNQRADSDLREQLKEAADKVITSLPNENQLLSKVKKLILEAVSANLSPIDQVAEKLNMSPRTLQRKLKALNTSFRHIQNEVKLQLAQKLIRKGINNVDEIAYLTGYSESSALIRAFRVQTGITPRQYYLNN